MHAGGHRAFLEHPGQGPVSAAQREAGLAQFPLGIPVFNRHLAGLGQRTQGFRHSAALFLLPQLPFHAAGRALGSLAPGGVRYAKTLDAVLGTLAETQVQGMLRMGPAAAALVEHQGTIDGSVVLLTEREQVTLAIAGVGGQGDLAGRGIGPGNDRPVFEGDGLGGQDAGGEKQQEQGGPELHGDLRSGLERQDQYREMTSSRGNSA